jgi:hypothetical protein
MRPQTCGSAPDLSEESHAEQEDVEWFARAQERARSYEEQEVWWPHT